MTASEPTTPGQTPGQTPRPQVDLGELATQLHAAVELDERQSFTTLLQDAGNQQTRMQLLKTLFRTACMKGSAYMVRVLLQVPSKHELYDFLSTALDPLQPSQGNGPSSGSSALHIVAAQGNQECVEAVLNSQLDAGKKLELLEARNTAGRTALHEAVQQDSGSVVELLLKHHSEILAGPPDSGAEAGPPDLRAEACRIQAFFQAEAYQVPDLGRAPTSLQLQVAAAQQRKFSRLQPTGQVRGGTALELAVKQQKLDALLPLLVHLRSLLSQRSSQAWAQDEVAKVLQLAARQRTTHAMEVLVDHLPVSDTTMLAWREALKQALLVGSPDMVKAMAEVARSPYVVTLKVLQQASRRKQSFIALTCALTQTVELSVAQQQNDKSPWEPTAHPILTPTVVRATSPDVDGRNFELLERQRVALEGTPIWLRWSSPDSCQASLLPAHLLERKVLFEVLEVLVLHNNDEVFRTPFAQGVVAEAWDVVSKFYYLDMVLNGIHIAVAWLLTVETEAHDLFTGPKYIWVLLGVVSLLVAKDAFDELFQFCNFRWKYLQHSDNYFDAGRVLMEIAAMGVLWSQRKEMWCLVIIGAWVAWMWVHLLADLRGVYGFGHHTVPIIQAIFSINVVALASVLLVLNLAASHAYYVFGEVADLFEAIKPVFLLSFLGNVEVWEVSKDDPRYGVVQVHIFVLSCIFVIPVPLFISVLGSNYSSGVQRAAASFSCGRAMLAIEYNVATLPRVLRSFSRCLGSCLGCRGLCSTEVEDHHRNGELPVLIS